MSSDANMRHRAHRDGFTLVEATLAMVVLSMAAAGVLLPFADGASVQAEGLHRSLAASLANELLERIISTPFDRSRDQTGTATRRSRGISRTQAAPHHGSNLRELQQRRILSLHVCTPTGGHGGPQLRARLRASVLSGRANSGRSPVDQPVNGSARPGWALGLTLWIPNPLSAYETGSMEPRLMKTTRYMKAFTLVELLVTMVVTGILLSAVATLAFAMSSASRSSDDTILNEAQLRQTRLRIGELVRTCKLICAAPGNDLAIWQADTNNDGQINVGELVYIERGDGLNTLQLCQFSAGQNDTCRAVISGSGGDEGGPGVRVCRDPCPFDSRVPERAVSGWIRPRRTRGALPFRSTWAKNGCCPSVRGERDSPGLGRQPAQRRRDHAGQ